MRLLNPHSVFWLAASPVEIEAWFTQLKKQNDSVVPFGDLPDARAYLVSLIKPGQNNSGIESIATRREPQPVRLFLCSGKIIGFVVTQEVSK